ncbi:MAG: hypothetical protein V3U87_07660 [Methylococcaceae bacterium]
MKLGRKTVTKTMRQVVDEKLIEKHGDKTGKLRCQATFDDRGSTSFNGMLRMGRNGEPQINDNGSGTNYVIAYLPDFTNVMANAGLVDGGAVELARMLEELNGLKPTSSGSLPINQEGLAPPQTEVMVRINTENVRNAWNSTFFIQKNSRFAFLNKKGELIFSLEKDALPALQETFGWFIDGLLDEEGDSKEIKQAKKEYRKKVKECFFKHVRLYRQRTEAIYEVDMFAKKASIDIAMDEKVFVKLLHRPFETWGVGGMSRDDSAILAEYKEHFPQFDELLNVLCASRFANSRRQSFIWLHVASNWGKGLLEKVFKNVGIVSKVSVKEIEKAFEGQPLGKNSAYFRRSWILWVDEFKTVKSEIKELTDEISAAPKNELNFCAPLYLKIFTSAETVDSLAGEKGVEKQFINRFNYMSPPANDIDHLPLLIRDKGKYISALTKYVGEKLNAFVEEMREMGRVESASHCDKILAKFHKANNIGIEFGSIDDSVNEMANKLKEILIDFSKNSSGLQKLPEHLNQILKANCIGGTHDKFGKVIVLTSWSKFIKEWIETDTDKSGCLYEMEGKNNCRKV